jgi:hypothetical protein
MISLGVGTRTIFGKLRLWLKGQIVGDVPPELGLCEFDCRKRECLLHEWEDCKNRLSYLALPANSGGHGTPLFGLIEADQKHKEIERESAERIAISHEPAKTDAMDRARLRRLRLERRLRERRKA